MRFQILTGDERRAIVTECPLYSTAVPVALGRGEAYAALSIVGNEIPERPAADPRCASVTQRLATRSELAGLQGELRGGAVLLRAVGSRADPIAIMFPRTDMTRLARARGIQGNELLRHIGRVVMDGALGILAA